METLPRALLLTDLVDSTALIERLGDAGSARVFAEVEVLTRGLLLERGGREIDKTDGFLLLFERAYDAAAFALDLHDGLAELSAKHSEMLRVRCGIHFAEVVVRNNPAAAVTNGAKPVEIEGLAKPIAARVMSLASGGQTLLTRAAFDLARRADQDSPLRGTRWARHGPYLLKGVAEPMEICEVVRDARPAAPARSEKARPLTRGRPWAWLALAVAALLVIGAVVAWPSPQVDFTATDVPAYSEDESRQQLLQQAWVAYLDGEDFAAEDAVDVLLQEDPAHPDLVALDTLIHLGMDPRKALTKLDGWGLPPEHAHRRSARLLSALNALSRQQQDAAGFHEQLDALREMAPEDLLVPFFHAVVRLTLLGDPAGAEQLRAITEQHPKLVMPYLIRVAVAPITQESAESIMEQALAVNPVSAPLYGALAEYHANRREWAPAQQAAARALELDPAMMTARALAGGLALWVGDEAAFARHRSFLLGPEAHPVFRDIFFKHALYAAAANGQFETFDSLIDDCFTHGDSCADDAFDYLAMVDLHLRIRGDDALDRAVRRAEDRSDQMRLDDAHRRRAQLFLHDVELVDAVYARDKKRIEEVRRRGLEPRALQSLYLGFGMEEQERMREDLAQTAGWYGELVAGDLLWDRGRLDEAEAHFSSSLEEKQLQDALFRYYARLRLAQLLDATNRPVEAQARAEEALGVFEPLPRGLRGVDTLRALSVATR